MTYNPGKVRLRLVTLQPDDGRLIGQVWQHHQRSWIWIFAENSNQGDDVVVL